MVSMPHVSDKKQGKPGRPARAAERLDAQMAALEKMMAEQQNATPGIAQPTPFVAPAVAPAAPAPTTMPAPVARPSSGPAAPVAGNPMLRSLQMHLRQHAGAEGAQSENQLPAAKNVEAETAEYQTLASMLEQIDQETETMSFQELGCLVTCRPWADTRIFEKLNDSSNELGLSRSAVCLDPPDQPLGPRQAEANASGRRGRRHPGCQGFALCISTCQMAPGPFGHPPIARRVWLVT
ncbi:unnamed protein product [Durusdinium trenchii]|uniref:Uncharacterized protein n=1 Tax=Durusdinium trenchii TaxID=1381693 RepID=A0ABP0H7E7_9DINO